MISVSNSQITQLEAEKDILVREKTKREVEIEDIMRQLKQLDDEKSSLKHLKAMELHTLKS